MASSSKKRSAVVGVSGGALLVGGLLVARYLHKSRKQGKSHAPYAAKQEEKQPPYTVYKHKPLTSRTTIRLLKYEPSEQLRCSCSDNVLHFSMVEHELRAEEIGSLGFRVKGSPYVAMSYSWGASDSDSHLIILDGEEHKVFKVTPTAREAVHRTARTSKYPIWIDQVCINQSDDQEKAATVALMGEIYSRCQTCIIWLGPADEDTEAAFLLCKKIEKAWPKTKQFNVDNEEVVDLTHAKVREKLMSRFGRDRLPSADDPGWRGLANILSRGWFTRTWTFQEAILSDNSGVLVRCGEHECSIFGLMRSAMCLGVDHMGQLKADNGRASLAQISKFLYHFREGELVPLIWLLQNNNMRDCTNPRDRIYAYLGVRREDGPNWEVNVDYKASVKDVFTDIVRKIVQHQGSLNICMAAPERHPALDNALILPSWVPDWTRRPLTLPFERLSPTQSYFEASRRRKYTPVYDGPDILVATGREVNHIASIIDVEIPDKFTIDERKNVLVCEVLPRLYRKMQERNSHKCKVDIAYSIVDTICVGGYTGRENQGDFTKRTDDWPKDICEKMLSHTISFTDPYSDPAPDAAYNDWIEIMARRSVQCVNRRFALLKDGSLALVPKMAGTGKNYPIVILHGASLPFVLKYGKNGNFEMVGTCYVGGMMKGEKCNWTEGNGHEFRIC